MSHLRLKVEEEAVKYESTTAQNTARHEVEEQRMKTRLVKQRQEEEAGKVQYMLETKKLNVLQDRCSDATSAAKRARDSLANSAAQLLAAQDRVDDAEATYS